MDAIHLGPFLIPLTRAYVALALAGLTAEVLARTVDRRFASWGWNAVLAGLVTARLGFVLTHLSAYTPDPLSVLYVWQGGFDPVWGIAGGAAYTLWSFRTQRSLLRWTLAPAGLAGAVWLILSGLAPNAAASTSTDTLPSLVFERLDGTRVALTEYTGRPVVLNLWATWCPPCRREMPLLAETARARPEVAFVFLNQGEGRLAVQAFLEEEGLALPEVLLDPETRATRHFRAIGLPTTLFFDAEGRLVARHVGELSRAALLGYLNQIAR